MRPAQTMATLIDTIQPPVTYLTEALQDAIIDQTEQQFMSLWLENCARRLDGDPAQYRSFGPWWPAVKNMLIGAEYNQFGLLVDADVIAIYHYPQESLNLVAAHLYSMERFDQGLIYSAQHLLQVNETADDTEPYDYQSFDPEVEFRISSST